MTQRRPIAPPGQPRVRCCPFPSILSGAGLRRAGEHPVELPCCLTLSFHQPAARRKDKVRLPARAATGQDFLPLRLASQRRRPEQARENFVFCLWLSTHDFVTNILFPPRLRYWRKRMQTINWPKPLDVSSLRRSAAECSLNRASPRWSGHSGALRPRASTGFVRFDDCRNIAMLGAGEPGRWSGH